MKMKGGLKLYYSRYVCIIVDIVKLSYGITGKLLATYF